MNTPLALAALLTAATVWAGWSYGARRPELARLRAEQARRTSANPGDSGPATPRVHVPSPEADPGTRSGEAASRTGEGSALTPDERLELLRLRSEVTDLKIRRRALDGVSNVTARLEASLTTVSNYARGRMPAGFRSRSEATNAGLATPEAAIETFFWVLEHRDAARLLEVLAGEEREGVKRMVEAQGGDAFFRESPPMAGYRIRLLQKTGDGEAKADLEVGPGPVWTVHLVREDGGWRLRP